MNFTVLTGSLARLDSHRNCSWAMACQMRTMSSPTILPLLSLFSIPTSPAASSSLDHLLLGEGRTWEVLGCDTVEVTSGFEMLCS